MNWRTPEDRFTVGFITAVSVGFVIVVFAVKGDMHPLWDWMHKWQTMITGLAAVAAAWLTILHMRSSQKKQEDINRRIETIRTNREISYAASVMRDYTTTINLLNRFTASLQDGTYEFPDDDVEGLINFSDFLLPAEIDASLSRQSELFCKSIHEINQRYSDYAKNACTLNDLGRIATTVRRQCELAASFRNDLAQIIVRERVFLLASLDTPIQTTIDRHRLEPFLPLLNLED